MRHQTEHSFIKFVRYKCYHTVHPQNTARGGSAVIIRDNLIHYEEASYRTDAIQATVVNVKTSRYNFNVCSAYFPPRNNLKKIHYLEFLKSLGEKFIVGGDFNTKNKYWGSRLTTVKGKEMLSALKDYGCECHSTGKPTYWPTDLNKKPDLLDFFISRKISANYVDIEENFDLSSDHSPIILTLSETLIRQEATLSLINKTTDWESFQINLNNLVKLNISLQSKEELDYETEKFITDIQQAAWKNTAKTQPVKKGQICYPMEVKKLVVEKRKARRKWQNTRHPVDKNKLNNLTQRLNRKIKEIKENTMNSFLMRLTADIDTNYSLWKATKRIKRPIMQVPPLKAPNGEWVRKNNQKADLFASYLEETFHPHDTENDSNFHDIIYHEESEIISPVTPKEVETEI